MGASRSTIAGIGKQDVQVHLGIEARSLEKDGNLQCLSTYWLAIRAPEVYRSA